MSYIDELLHSVLNYVRINFSGGTLHYMCDILSDNFIIGRVQESGGSDMLVIFDQIYCVLNLLAFV